MDSAASSWLVLEALLIGVFGSWIAATIWQTVYNVHLHPLANYPGPALRAASALPEALSAIAGTAYKDTRSLHERYGSVVRVSPSAISFASAQAWKDIYGLKSDRTELAKDPAYYKKGDAVNIVVADQADHTRIRKLFAHAFSDTALLEQESLLTQYFDLLISKLVQRIEGPSHGLVDMMAYYNFITFDIIGDLTLGEPFGALESGEYHDWIRNVFESIKFLGVLRFAANFPIVGLMLKGLTILKPSIAAKRAAHFEFTRVRIEKRLDNDTDRKDFLTYVLRHNDERGMTRAEIMGTCRVLLVAGSETTATLLSGATYYLLENSAALHRVQKELRHALRTPNEINLRSVSTTGLLPYFEAVIQESFRCYPPLPVTLPRNSGSWGAMVDGHFVPPGVSVGVHQWSTYHSADNFSSPDEFDPERWLANPPSKYKNDDKAALQPFSLGPRGCLGKSLAYFEIRSILARVLWHFDLEPHDSYSRWADQKEYSLWDKPSLWVKLKHRKN